MGEEGSSSPCIDLTGYLQSATTEPVDTLQPNLVTQMDGIRVTNSVSIPNDEITLRFSRSGGPGGQNVNRRETRVELVFDVASSPSLGPRQRVRAMERLRNRLDSRGKLRIV